ncbi:MAG: VWA domain-containing protein [Phototrophicaceae bacterium]
MALDISSSMQALDLSPNRLQSAKEEIIRFIDLRDYDRIGVVLFANEAYQYVPPTLDYTVLKKLVQHIKLASEYGFDDHTAIGMGLSAAANMLRESTAPSRIIILLTDGANNAGSITPSVAASAISALGIKVYTVGIGQEGRIPFALDVSGNYIYRQSDLDETTLIAIAEETGGNYYRVKDVETFNLVYQEINALEKTEIERDIQTSWRDLGGGLVVVSIIFLLLDLLFRYTIWLVIP